MGSNYVTERFHKDIGMKAGKDYETALLGKVDVNNPAYIRAYNQYVSSKIGNRAKEHYMDFAAAAELAKKFQPWPDPTNPQKDFLKELRLSLAEQLDLDDQMANNLTMYTAVATPLDVYHGVDAFVEYRLPDGRTLQITLDVTLNEKKINTAGGRADFIVSDIPDISEGQDAYLTAIEKCAQQIAKKIKAESKPARRPSVTVKQIYE